MKLLKLSVLLAFLAISAGSHAAQNADFQNAAQLLNAARSGNVQMVEHLINNGANINYVDGTGLSVVCTAIMNNDMKAAQILQVYGADASRCDHEIRRYKEKLPKENSGGLFSGLSNAQNITLAAGGAALVIGGVYLLGDELFGSDSSSGSSGGTGGDRPGSGNGDPDEDTATARVSTAYGPAEWNITGSKPNAAFNVTTEINALFPAGAGTDFEFMSSGGRQNYMLMMMGYSGFARGYDGQITARTPSSNAPKISDTLMAPISVALVAANGVNPTGTATDQEICLNRDAVLGCAGATDRYHRYKNIANDGSEITTFDFSGVGTVFDTNATEADSLLAKIIIGGTAAGTTRTTADFIGFMPNGQLLLYRTGGGKQFNANLGAMTSEDANFWYVGGTPYDKTGSFALIDGDIWSFVSQPYRNYQAMKDALGKSTIIANASTPTSMRDAGLATIGTISASATPVQTLLRLIDEYYYMDGDIATISNPDPGLFFNTLSSGGTNGAFVVFSTGEYVAGTAPGQSLSTLTSTFENAAPIAYSSLNHHFLTAAAVQYTAGTSNVNSASGAVKSGKYVLSSYNDGTNTIATRACGVAGLGSGNIDPWCFASAGKTGDQAVAALAGAAGLLKGAYFYMTMDQIFTLLALTSDGKYYGQSDLANMYQLPTDWLAELPATTATNYADKWMELFNRAFGYGLPNIGRATKPNEKLYFYSGTSTKDGYWSSTPSINRAATMFNSSLAFGARSATISVPMFDFIESADGSVSMPRVFMQEFSLGGNVHGLNLSSLIAEIDETKPALEIKNGSFAFTATHTEKSGSPTFTDANPYFALAGSAINNQASFDSGDWQFGFQAMFGNVTRDGLLATDPAISGNFDSSQIGSAFGFDSSARYGNAKFNFGYLEEDNTTLGAESGGLLDLGGGKTVYAGGELKLGVITAKYTMGRTETNPGFGFISNVSDMYSDSYSLNADFGKWSLNLARPLAVTSGKLSYVSADFEITDAQNGGYDLISSPIYQTIDLASDNRETRISLLYQPTISDRTKLAFGLVKRINPGNVSGHEEILMMKFRRIW